VGGVQYGQPKKRQHAELRGTVRESAKTNAPHALPAALWAPGRVDTQKKERVFHLDACPPIKCEGEWDSLGLAQQPDNLPPKAEGDENQSPGCRCRASRYLEMLNTA
jgi:hypothetical protein